ncbi:recombinase RecT [Lysobacter sp. ESA13C]|uniref:recombinase RecT n=1 Tax=Lysobacter sp. ESA13C TaxID=2862676 RepID=UPI001CBBDEA7|nr:recombinase RecT [Lysobacter sp. ESA13C]
MNAVVAHTPTTTETARAMTAGETAFVLAQRKAQAYSKSTLVPKDYQNNVPNVLIAMEVANRIGANDLMVMQNLYIVHGRPSWSASFLIATVNACKRFTPLRFETRGGDDATKDSYAVRAYAKDAKTGEECIGSWITWAMVKAEGWHGKAGSKWKTMPEQMFMYRAATFWARVYAPEVSMGIHTADEVEDIVGHVQTVGAEVLPRTDHSNLRQLEAQLTGKVIEAEPGTSDDDLPELSAEGVRAAMNDAETVDQLNDAFDLVRELPTEEHADLVAHYEQRRDALELDQQ